MLGCFDLLCLVCWVVACLLGLFVIVLVIGVLAGFCGFLLGFAGVLVVCWTYLNVVVCCFRFVCVALFGVGLNAYGMYDLGLTCLLLYSCLCCGVVGLCYLFSLLCSIVITLCLMFWVCCFVVGLVYIVFYGSFSGELLLCDLLCRWFWWIVKCYTWFRFALVGWGGLGLVCC